MITDTEAVARIATLPATALFAGVVSGCGVRQSIDGGTGTARYPLVHDLTDVARQPPVTMSSGSIVVLPALPKAYRVEPSASCQRALVSVPAGDGWTKKTVLIPPTPGLRAVALDSHSARVTWWFRDVPDECKPVVIRISIVAGTDPNATPLTREIRIDGGAGSVDLTYPDFLKPPTLLPQARFSMAA